MNEMNELEKQLRTWLPRRPSPRLKASIFATSQLALANHTSSLAEETPASSRFGWLLPATAALLLTCLIFSQRASPAISGSTESGPLVAMILSNQSSAAYLPASYERVQNRLLSDTFEWTNGSGSTSTISSVSLSRGNN